MKEKKTKEVKPLSEKDRATLARYFLHWNGTRAWMEIHPKSSYDAARSSAAEFLAKPNVKAEIEKRLALVQMSADEALQLNADIARGDITEFMNKAGGLDYEALMKSGKGKLVKKIKQKVLKAVGESVVMEVELELYPADAAIERVLKVHEKIKDPGTVIQKAYINVSPDDWDKDEKE
jgi:phage terminase small subunit